MVPTRRFAPYVQVNDQASTTAIMARTPLISCSDVNNIQYGHSLLFVKKGSTASSYVFQILLTARVEFYTFDGDDSVAVTQAQLRK